MASSMNVEVTTYGVLHGLFAGGGKKIVIMSYRSFYEDCVEELAATINKEG